MKPVTIDKLCYRIDGQPVYVYGGEFHYFRVPKSAWRERMRLFREAGGNCLATYVPWLLHEPREGEFVFRSGDGVLDFEEFVQIAQEEGLYVLVRPGPYQYSELANAGLPTWLIEKYPQVMARNMEGKTLSSFSISYVHPLVLEKARNWYRQVCPIIARHTVSQGGNIPFVQFDNELTGIHIWFGGLDYNSESMGFGQPGGRYPRFLQQRYGELDKLNRAYETSYPSFADVRPIEGHRFNVVEMRRIKDYFDFYLHTIAEYGQTLTGMMREFGIDVPVVHNSANASMDCLFLETVDALKGQFLLGSDHYYNLEGQNNPTPEYAVKVFYSNEMLRMMGFPPTVYELPGGISFDWPPVTPEDEACCYMLNTAYGMKGHNYYIFTGGPNPPAAGVTCDDYDYNASIGSKGEIRPLYQVQKEFGRFWAEHPWLPEAVRECDFRVALDWELPRSSYYWKRRGDLLLSNSEAWDFLRKGLLVSSFCASFSPTLCDIRSEEWLADKSTPVAVVSSVAMARGYQERIVRFLQQGGRVLLAPMAPTLDDRLEPCTVLADFIGARTKAAPEGGSVRFVMGDSPTAIYGASVYFSDPLPAGVEIVGKDVHSGQPIAWKRTFPGGGQLLMLNARWNHHLRDHQRLIAEAFKPLSIQPIVQCSNPNVWTSLRSAGDHSLLFLINLFTGTMECEVTCQPAWSDKKIDTGKHQLRPMSVKVVELA